MGIRDNNFTEHAAVTREAPPKATFQSSWFGNIPAGFLMGAVFLYVVGWSYLYGYYSAFGLSLRDVSFDINEIMIRARRGWTWWLLLLVGVFSALSLASISWWLRNRKTRKKEGGEGSDRRLDLLIEWVPIILLLGIGLVVLDRLSLRSIHSGQDDAARDMTAEDTTLPVAELVIDKSKLPLDLLASPNDQIIRGNILVHVKGGYYVLPRMLKGKPQGPREAGNIEILFIPEQSVLGARFNTAIQRGRR